MENEEFMKRRAELRKQHEEELKKALELEKAKTEVLSNLG